MQNTSHAVMAQRIEPKDSADDFAAPPWATRALVEHVFDDKNALRSMSCLEPACGAGHMAKVLREYFGEVHAFDAYHYGYGPVRATPGLCGRKTPPRLRVWCGCRRVEVSSKAATTTDESRA